MCITLCDEFASRSFFLRCSKILTSMSAWWWNLFLFLQGQWKCALLKRGRAFMEYASPEGKRKKINAGCVRYYPRIIVGVFSFSRIIARGESSFARRWPHRFRVPDDLDGDVLSGFVIQRSNHLTETSLANHLQYLVSDNRKYCRRVY